MACGLPVVCNDSGGNCELVVDCKSGFIIPSFDAQALCENLTWLANNPSFAREMGEFNRARFTELFGLERMLKQTLAVYDELVEK